MFDTKYIFVHLCLYEQMSAPQGGPVSTRVATEDSPPLIGSSPTRRPR